MSVSSPVDVSFHTCLALVLQRCERERERDRDEESVVLSSRDQCSRFSVVPHFGLLLAREVSAVFDCVGSVKRASFEVSHWHGGSCLGGNSQCYCYEAFEACNFPPMLLLKAARLLHVQF